MSTPALDFSVGKLMALASGQVNEFGEMHGLCDLYLRNGEEFQVMHGTPDGRRRSPG